MVMYFRITENKIRKLCDVDLSKTTIYETKSNLEEAVKLVSRDFNAHPLDTEEQYAKRIIAKITAYQQIISGYQNLITNLYLTDNELGFSKDPKELQHRLDLI